MNRDKQIDEMARDMCDGCREAVLTEDCPNTVCEGVRLHAEVLYAKGYRKIHDDDARQCICYALGCQMAEGLKRKVAEKIFEEIEKFNRPPFPEGTAVYILRQNEFTELKKKYTEGGK